MKVLLLGAGGRLGHELRWSLSLFADVVAPDRNELDVGDLSALAHKLDAERPAVVVNACAHNNVDDAEQDPRTAQRINTDVVALLGERARRLELALVHFSTDYVFDGAKATAYTEEDPTGPVNVYGRSKLAGEQALLELDAPALVFRTAWLYTLRRACFVTYLLKEARRRDMLQVVDDEVGNPTWCRELAQAVGLLLFGMRRSPYEAIRDARGIYHLAAPDSTSRYELATAVLELDPARADQRVRRVGRVSSAAFGALAERPLRTALDCSKAARRFGLQLGPWRESLACALARLTEAG